VALLVLSGFCLPAHGADLLDRVKRQEINQILRLKVGRSRVWRTPFPGRSRGRWPRATALALPFAGGKKEKVVNIMHEGGVQQVMLEVRVAEINRLVAERIGVNFNGKEATRISNA
jgi:Flp pilus assembly secretin CpaC